MIGVHIAQLNSRCHHLRPQSSQVTCEVGYSSTMMLEKRLCQSHSQVEESLSCPFGAWLSLRYAGVGLLTIFRQSGVALIEHAILPSPRHLASFPLLSGKAGPSENYVFQSLLSLPYILFLLFMHIRLYSLAKRHTFRGSRPL